MVLEFAFGLMTGLALGLIVTGFLAIAAYQRGHADAQGRRKHWRAEIVARQAAARLPAVSARKAG